MKKCFRKVCTSTYTPFFNTSTREWYCPECATAINNHSMHDHNIVLCFTFDHLPEEEKYHARANPNF